MGLSSSNEMQAEDFSIIRKENEIYKNISHIDHFGGLQSSLTYADHTESSKDKNDTVKCKNNKLFIL